jgi:hypothetical protein
MRRLILVLALTALVWAQITVENVQCTKIWGGNVDTTQGVPISFSFGAVGPVMGLDFGQILRLLYRRPEGHGLGYAVLQRHADIHG